MNTNVVIFILVGVDDRLGLSCYSFGGSDTPSLVVWLWLRWAAEQGSAYR